METENRPLSPPCFPETEFEFEGEAVVGNGDGTDTAERVVGINPVYRFLFSFKTAIFDLLYRSRSRIATTAVSKAPAG